ncbi:hypothetical protein GOP47_0008614 [Adiantum capillus-veneris]|uniref:Uncharacterized protein n=1 Tax=Adiantum capillus-veneris TaxID=13818 RepID=A0A9D4UYX7_ADICA|nr:hypothetical protein GOP47_0008614 [Adiantum capillus-veneris]
MPRGTVSGVQSFEWMLAVGMQPLPSLAWFCLYSLAQDSPHGAVIRDVHGRLGFDKRTQKKDEDDLHMFV